MTILKWLEGQRTPWLDGLMSAITELGDETIFMLAGLVILWCVNKRWGFRFLLVGLTGSIMNQLLKAIFLIPRPWVQDPSFTIVESARAGATGYSFPSGHTQSAATLFGTLAMWSRKWWSTLLCVVMVLLVGLSRMYLGVHTPLDVGVSLLTGVVTVVALYDEAQTLPLPEMYGKNLTFKTGGVDGCDCAEILRLIQQGKLDTTPLITHRYALSEIEQAYRIFENRLDGVIKVAITAG